MKFHAELYALQAELLRRKGDYHQARKLVRKHLEEFPDYPTGQVLALLLDPEDTGLLQRIQRLFPRFPIPAVLLHLLHDHPAVMEDDELQMLEQQFQGDRLDGDLTRRLRKLGSEMVEQRQSDFLTPSISRQKEMKSIIHQMLYPAQETTPVEDASDGESFRRDLEQALADPSREPDDEIIRKLSGHIKRGTRVPIKSRQLAELLHRQGHTAEAVSMLKQLDPQTDEIARRIEELEQQSQGD